MKIYPSTVSLINIPPTSILNVLQSNNLKFPNDNVVQFVALHLQKLNSNQALHVISNLITQELVKYEDAEYEVESIEDHDWDEVDQTMRYLIKWRGWPIECATWEPEPDLTNCQELLKEYKNFISGKSRKRRPTAAEVAESSERSKARVLQLLDCINFDDLTPERFEQVLAETLTKRALQSVAKRRILPSQSRMIAGSKRSLAIKIQAELKNWELLLNANEPQAKIFIENKVDLEGPPLAFTYVTKRVPGPGVSIPDDPVLGCTCTDCYEERHSCVASHVHNEGRVPYTRQGRLPNVNASFPIHECNSLCKCGPDCPFRVVQRGRQFGLAIYRTKNRGWGVRTLQRIPRGSFVVEYVGEVVTFEEAERRGLEYDRQAQTYLFDLDLDGEPVYSVDARDYGNIAHFLNHSCSPNLTIRCVYTQCIDKDLPLLALFAAEPIPKGAELTFDYQMSGAISAEQQQQQQQLGADDASESAAENASVVSSSVGGASSINGGGLARMRCLCGSANCRRFLFD
ncbi:hypothetical protein BOX15_Mlig027750g1 [Macrostomum lignano]|uniref:Histone-lysine N-methyltransferase n=2 Tax=Macrostomum lignano TaxID=282301 RepID=A0A1I8J5Y4_9PLAT|nr:hypothetical protein BOX15_Mlig027750g1 [Macrostomum lignano]